MFDQARALAQSQAGTSVTQQMQQFAAGVLAELDAQHRAIERDDQALAAQKTTLKPADFERNLTLLRQRYAALDHTRQTRLGQLSTTRKAADGLVASALDPSLAAATTDRKCAIVVDRAATHGFNPAQTGGEWPLSRLGGDRLSSEAG